jgi:protein involved in sex pheromone biosynthesis
MISWMICKYKNKNKIFKAWKDNLQEYYQNGLMIAHRN